MFSSSLAYLGLKLRCELGVDVGSLLTVTWETATLAAAIAVVILVSIYVIILL